MRACAGRDEGDETPMKKVALLFVLAVLVPSVLLALLAARTLRDQQFVVERQQSLLYQAVTDALAKDINDYLADQQRQFNELVEGLVTNSQPQMAAASFDDRLRAAWPLAEVGFAVTLNGSLLCPSPAARPETRTFCLDNSGFLANRESVEVYWNDYSTKGMNQIALRGANPQTEAQQPSVNNALPNQARGEFTNYSPSASNLKVQSRKVNPAQQLQQVVLPNEQETAQQNVSKIMSAEAEFRQLIGDAKDGTVARFVQNKLRLMFWHRLARDPQLVFGAQVDLNRIIASLREIVEAKPDPELNAVKSSSYNVVKEVSQSGGWNRGEPGEIYLAVLDDNARPVVASATKPKTNWKRPFVATEIGEVLPHWEVAAYLMNPDSLKKTALTIRISLGLLIAVLLIAMIVGSWLIVNDLNRQVTLARQKTDFVSNVSHELKTPLTSIRMFSELLAEGRVNDPAKQRSYLHIITAEAARLTRLINNVLDFSRFERGEKKYNFQDCDLARLVRETAETYRPHLENNGFKLDCQLPATPVPVRGDGDALAQVIVNLLSNAEKYSNGAKEIALSVERRSAPLPHAEVRVLDRGPGVPAGSEEKIFEQFYRAHDSLSSGIQGSGLGLTLARQIARAHGGDVVYEPREDGGSCFSLRLPLTPSLSPSDGERVAEGRVRG